MVLNYLFRFMFSLYYSERLHQLLSGELHGITVTQEFLLAISILMEVPIAMILLTRVLKHKPNRVLNIVAAVIMLAVHLSGISPADVSLHYYFFNAIEIALCIGIIVTTIRWKEETISNA